MSASPDLSARTAFLDRLDARVAALREALGALAEGDEDAVGAVRRIARLLEGSARPAGFPAVEEPASRVAGGPRRGLEARVEALLAALAEVRAEATRPGRPRRILVVEDNREVAHLAAVLLASEGRTVECVEDGAAALSRLEGDAPDLVVLDLVLPDTDGRKLLVTLRERPDTAQLPVVVLSARTSPRIRSECLALGAAGFLEKPVDPRALVDAVDAVDALVRRAAEAERAAGMDRPTGLRNRAGIREAYDGLDRDVDRGVAVLSIDGFEGLAEERGLDVADVALVGVAGALVAALEAAGEGRAVPGRWQGGEFVVLFPGRSGEALRERVEELLEAVRRVPLLGPDGEVFHVTASSALVTPGKGRGLQDCLEVARRGVDRVREQGGNRLFDPEAEPGGDGAAILVAEDDPVTATLLSHRLRKEGYEVRHFANGRDAYEAALAAMADLVVLDVRMPGMGGFELLGRLRRVPAYHDVPVILLTSLGSEDDLVRGFDLGADDYIVKPFSPTELVARVRRLLRPEPAVRRG